MSEHIFQTMKEHMLDGNNIARWYRYMVSDETINNKQHAIKKTHSKLPTLLEPIKCKDCFVPKTKDKLFWCFFVALKGYDEFMKVRNKMFVHENETKYAAVLALRENKDKLKHSKIKLQEAECDLVGAKPLSITVLHALAIAYSLSFIVFNEEIYYDFSYGEKTFVIDMTKGEIKLLLGDQTDKIATIKQTKYYISSSKPIKASSSYTAKEIQEIASKLSIVLVDETGKTHNKQVLYSLIKGKLEKLI